MLLHIRPRMFARYRNISLIDLVIDPFGMRLVGGIELATRRPYPNKWYKVACRKEGRKAVDGILINVPTPIDNFAYSARWAVEAAQCVTHRVEYSILDHDFDAASDSMMLWHACSEGLGGWSNRFPEAMRGIPPLATEPRMEVEPRDCDNRRTCEDVIESGWIISRREVFAMPTIERERITNSRLHRPLPALGSAFTI